MISFLFCVLVIQCDGDDLRCHQLILASHSPYLKDLLLSTNTPDHDAVLILPDFQFEDVSPMLQFLYGSTEYLDSHLESIFTTLGLITKQHGTIRPSTLTTAPALEDGLYDGLVATEVLVDNNNLMHSMKSCVFCNIVFAESEMFGHRTEQLVCEECRRRWSSDDDLVQHHNTDHHQPPVTDDQEMNWSRLESPEQVQQSPITENENINLSAVEFGKPNLLSSSSLI